MSGEIPNPHDPLIKADGALEEELVTLPALDGNPPQERPPVESDVLVYGPAPKMVVREGKTPPIQAGHPKIRR